MMAFPALNGLLAHLGCPQVGHLLDTSSWVGGDGLRRLALCARTTHGLRRPSLHVRTLRAEPPRPIVLGVGEKKMDCSTGAVGEPISP